MRAAWAACHEQLACWLDTLFRSSARFTWSTEYVALVETTELQDRDVYRHLTAVSVRKTIWGEYLIRVDLPGIDVSELRTTVADGSVVLEFGNGSKTTTSGSGCSPRYSLVLPRECNPTTLRTEASGDGLLITGSRGSIVAG